MKGDNFLKKNLSGSRFVGAFEIEEGQNKIYGELKLAGNKTSLYLQDDEHIEVNRGNRFDMRGVLKDKTHVTLIDCISAGSGTTSGKSGQYHHANVFPHSV